MTKYNLLDIVDMQNAFLSSCGPLCINKGEELISKVSNFVNTMNNQKHSIDVVLIKQDTHIVEEYNNSLEAAQFPMHCEFQTYDWKLSIPLLKGNHDTYFMLKNKFDMWDDNIDCNNNYKHNFFSILNENFEIKYNSINELLKLYNNKNTNVYLFGVASDFCVKYAILGYLKRGYNVHVISDFTLGIDKDINYVANYYFSEFLSNGKLLLIDSSNLLNKLS